MRHVAAHVHNYNTHGRPGWWHVATYHGRDSARNIARFLCNFIMEDEKADQD